MLLEGGLAVRTGCVLHARPGGFQSTHAEGLADALCPQCQAAARPTRGGLEQAVLITAGQALADADRLSTESASAAEPG